MEHQHSKYVKIVCSLNIGDTITTNIHNSIKNKKCKIIDIKYSNQCESGFMVRIQEYVGWFDSNWIISVQTNLNL